MKYKLIVQSKQYVWAETELHDQKELMKLVDGWLALLEGDAYPSDTHLVILPKRALS